VNASWDETASEPNEVDAVTGDAAIVSDGDDGIITTSTVVGRLHQLDLVHIGQTLDYSLWNVGVFS
jgi:hypothetical protein